MADPLDTLLWGGGVIQTQGPKPRAMAQAPAPAASDPLDRLLFPDAPVAQAPSPAAGPAPFPGYKDPKSEGWLEWMGKNITGRQDPRFANAPAISRVLENEIYDQNSDAARSSYRNITAGQALTPDDQAHANIVKNALGNRFIGLEKDAYGADIVRYRDKDGREARAYVNKPGLDMEDVNNFGLQAVPYLIGGRIAGGLTRNMSLPFKMLGQAGTAAATSVAGDTAAMEFGSGQAPDIGRATAVGLMGGAAEALSPGLGLLWRKLVTEPGLFNKSTGQLTAKGAEAAQKAGFDPADITPDLAEQFAKKYAEIRNPQVAGQSVRGQEFDIPVTRGQMEKDPGRLLNEKAMRYGAFGDPAKSIIQGLDQRQTAAISEAALGGGRNSVANVINPNRAAAGAGPRDVGEGVVGGVRAASAKAKQQASEQWKKVESLTATDDALELLPSAIASQLNDVAANLTKDTAPKSTAMLDALRKFKKKGEPKEADDFLGSVEMPTVDTMRRNLFSMIKGTSPDEFDGMAARRIYDGFNKWIKDAADQELLNGDPNAAAMLRVAIDRTREMKTIFSDRNLAGKKSAGGELIKRMLNDDNIAPETIVRKLFTVDAGATPKPATLDALRRIKTGINKYLPSDEAGPVWNDIRLAHWMNLVKTSSGELHTPTMLAKRIDQAMNAQSSLMKELYKPEEIALIRRFGAAMKDVAYKDPNPSGTGTAQLFYAGQWGQALLSMLSAYNGPLGKITQTIMRSTPVGDAAGYVAAQSAVAPKMRPKTPSLGAIGAGITAQERETR